MRRRLILSRRTHCLVGPIRLNRRPIRTTASLLLGHPHRSAAGSGSIPHALYSILPASAGIDWTKNRSQFPTALPSHCPFS
jgi:hypothetical protein